MYQSHCFTDDPNHPGVVACFGVCPDDIASDLRTKVDAAAKEFFASHDFHIR